MIPVVLFHADIGVFSGGFVGVDIFFVISGYLITSIILTEQQNKVFSIKKFYERRVRRIFPALFFVILSSLLFSWFWLLPNEMKEFNESVLATIFFVSNIYFWETSNYFATESALIPFFHTWSLSIEEQFYILLPLSLLAFSFLRTGLLLTLFCIVAVASLAFSQIYLSIDPEASFYLLHMRVWELLVGVLAAFYLNFYRPRFNRRICEILTFVGLIFIVYAFCFFDARTSFPGASALFPTLGAFLIITFSYSNDTLVKKFLSTRLLVGIGLISYSTYLWHQPIFAFAKLLSVPDDFIASSGIIGLGGMSLLILLAFVMGYISWKFVEAPFRLTYSKNGKSFSTQTVYFISLSSLMVIFTFSFVGLANGGYKGRVNDDVLAIQNVKNDINPRRDQCHASRKKYVNPGDACVIGDHDNVIGVLIGDSHADALVVELDKQLSERGIGLKQMTYGGCPPITNAYRSDARNDRCDEFFTEAFRIVEQSDHLNNVIFHARWSRYYPGPKFTRGVTHLEYGSPSIIGFFNPEGKRHKYSEIQIKRNIDSAYSEIITTQLNNGKNAILVYPVPYAIWDPPSRYAALKFRWGVSEDMETPYKLFTERNKYAYEVFDSIPTHPNLKKIFPAQYLCDPSHQGQCKITENDILYFKDHTHLSSNGAKLFVPEIIDLLEIK